MKKTVSMKLGISIGVIAVIALIIGYIVLELQAGKIKDDVYKNTINDLQIAVTNKFNSKKAIGLTNAYSIANDGQIKKALLEDQRDLAIASLKNVSTTFKNNTAFKNIKVHIHTKENKSYLRNWKPEKFGDDLSSFRKSVVHVNSTKKPAVGFEIGKAGLGLRAVVPVIDQGIHLGSLEFMQGLNSVAKAFNKSGDAFLLLMDGKLKVASVDASKMFKNFIISQKFVDKNFLNDAKNVDFNTLYSEKSFTTDNYFYTYADVKDFQGTKLGIALIGKPIEKVYHAIESSQTIISTALLLIIALVGFIIIFIVISIKKVVSLPLQDLEDAIQSLIKSNDTSSRVKVVSDDEIGQVASGFNDYLSHIEDGLKKDMKLIQEAEGVMAKVASGCFSGKITGATNNQSLNLLKDNINKMIDETQSIYQDINKLLDQYVNYNYTQELKVDGIAQNGLLQQLIDSINSLKTSITEMLVNNKTNGITLQNSSQDLLNNVSTLSTSSNEAAASLEETAAALEEITSTITSSNENVSQMASYATTVTDAASKGEELATRTVTSIDEINNEVTAINEAITVIDQIAFQTNILSLNAAVEAATAGEAGKGFAVVAQEVRNLAARSAEAAKEIKEIVEKATHKATSGKNIAQQMIEGYEHLNTNIDKTIDLIKEVETASKEQQAGIVQINDAVNSLDQQTQQNAVVANQANDIAISTQNIANDIVEDADQKEFIGKNDIKRKAARVAPISKPVKSAPKTVSKPAPSTPVSAPVQTKNIQPITSNTDDDEWASF